MEVRIFWYEILFRSSVIHQVSQRTWRKNISQLCHWNIWLHGSLAHISTFTHTYTHSLSEPCPPGGPHMFLRVSSAYNRVAAWLIQSRWCFVFLGFFFLVYCMVLFWSHGLFFFKNSVAKLLQVLFKSNIYTHNWQELQNGFGGFKCYPLIPDGCLSASLQLMWQLSVCKMHNENCFKKL